MRVSPAAELAVRGAVILAREYGQGPVTLDSICAKRDLPKQYMVKIFSSLARAGLVTPVRGKRGGYMLSRAPKDVSLLDIIEAVEGPVALNYCQQDPPQCDEDSCPIRSVWDNLQQAVCSSLGAMHLSDCTNHEP